MKESGNANFGWVGAGKEPGYFLQAWRHTCITLNFNSGRLSLVENGQKLLDGSYDNIVKFSKNFNKTANFATLGCNYRNYASAYQSTRGRVTDLQIYSRELSEKEMVGFTTCESVQEGDVVSWDKDQFVLNGTKSEVEILDTEADVCRNMRTNSSLVFVPIKQSFDPDGLRMCGKLSGRAAGHVSKQDLDGIVRYLRQKNIMERKICQSPVKGKNNTVMIESWLASDDKEEEGVWRDWYTDDLVEHMPWGPNRPYVGENSIII